MSRRLRTCAHAGLFALLPVIGLANDRWEKSFYMSDNLSVTHNELVHGSVQRGHDLQNQLGVPDRDYMTLRTKARHSYEARVSSGTTLWTAETVNCDSYCAKFDRVDTNGVVLTRGVADGAVNEGIVSNMTLAVRWIAGAGATEFLRAEGTALFNAEDSYDVELYDTTYFMPRFNNSSSQVTVLVVQNTTDALVTGEISFYNAAGTLLTMQPLSIAARGVLVLNSSTIPLLAGQSGSVSIAHLGGYGALSGKGVALEPATGFTFDTPLTALPR